jgi:hypothetical protein
MATHETELQALMLASQDVMRQRTARFLEG